MGHANLLVESGDGSSVLELLDVVLCSRDTVFAFGDDLDSAALVGRTGEVQVDDSGTQVLGELQEWEGSTRLDDNGLEAVLEHARRDELELLWSNELDHLAEATLLGKRLCVVSQNCYGNMV